jgi:CBS domain-containing protein
MRIEGLMKKFPATCTSDDTLSQAEQKMQNSNCASLLVTAGEESRCLVGMISDRDIGMARRFRDRSRQELRVRDAMVKEVRSCSPSASLGRAAVIMREAGIRFLPVVDRSGRLVGVLSLADVVCQLERERAAPSADVSAARLGLVPSRIHEPRRAGWPRRVAKPARRLDASIMFEDKYF